MTLATALLRAPHIGVRDLKAHLSEKLRTHTPLIITDHGEPKQVIIPYQEIVELVEILEEVRNPELVKVVKLSRKALREGVEGIPVEASFKKIRASRNKR